MKVLSGHGSSNVLTGEELLSWEPQVKFSEALRLKIDWVYSAKDHNQARVMLTPVLTDR